ELTHDTRTQTCGNSDHHTKHVWCRPSRNVHHHRCTTNCCADLITTDLPNSLPLSGQISTPRSRFLPASRFIHATKPDINNTKHNPPKIRAIFFTYIVVNLNAQPG
ncbi:unnamed protein product, partial [Ectocarpus fasciculatus]